MRRQFEARLDSLAGALRTLIVAIDGREIDAAQMAFRDARGMYKETEFLVTYYSPTLAGTLNGPNETDDPDAPPLALGRRAKFGIVEAALFGDSIARPYDEARVATAEMLRAVRSFRAATTLLDVSDTAALDAARLEVARVSTLGIAGFDSDESGDAVHESASAIVGIIDAVRLLQSNVLDSARRAQTTALLNAAANALEREPSFDSLDRYEFLVRYMNPGARAVLALRRQLDSRPPSARRLWRPSAATPFDAGAFDVSALAPEYAPASTPALISLGARLFADPNLSGARNRSCASCHQHSKAFTDGMARAAALDSSRRSSLRNTPTLINAALQQTMFADQRSGFVEDQIRVVLSSGAEMASSPELAAERIAADASYAPRLEKLTQRTVDERLIRVALAAYVRSLIALNAPFDRAVRGDSLAIDASARRGFNLFVGRARCGTCHFAPTFGGTMPPDFVRSELEVIGAPSTPVTRHAHIDSDSGRARVDDATVHTSAFRVPSVRNSAVTAPYMHNGVYRTLGQVIDFYDRGGGAGIGETLPSQTLSRRPLHLTQRDRLDLEAFLRSLTDTAIALPAH